MKEVQATMLEVQPKPRRQHMLIPICLSSNAITSCDISSLKIRGVSLKCMMSGWGLQQEAADSKAVSILIATTVKSALYEISFGMTGR